MPMFEYNCGACGRRFTALVGVVANPRPVACPRCGATDVKKRVSRFARLRSEDDTLESLCDETRYGDIENDPAALKRWMKDMSAAMDEDLGDDFEQALEEEMSGESSEEGAAADTADTSPATSATSLD
jgi:putative FmdB family regulatory protein